MEFAQANLLATSTQLSVTSNTALAENLFARDPYYQYVTNGFNDDNTTSSITVTFDQTTTVNRIGLLDFNYKEFRIFYDGLTANALALIGAETATCDYANNSDLNKYFRFNDVQVTSITIEAKSTIQANNEKLLSLLYISELTLDLGIIPSANNYKPSKDPKQIVHTMSDGGTKIHNIRTKWSTSFSLDYIDKSLRDGLLDIHASGSEFEFIPFGTSTAWDAILFECVWVGSFNFYEYSDNAGSSGFSGSVNLRETPA